MAKKKFYITTAIAYPNGRPHMGHALEIIQADALARLYKLFGEDVVFQTGTDEHGMKNWQTAEKEGLSVQDFLDKNVKVFVDLYKILNINYDNFIRTTDKNVHYKGANALWKKLVESGDLYKKKYKGLYCVGCESFKTEKELVDGKCPNHPTREIQVVEEENYFFKLSKYSKKIIEVIKKDEYKVVPETRKNEILSFLKGAKDISFSRPKSSLSWGIPVPDDEDHVMYVWCDALSNYITGAGYGNNEKRLKELWPADIHVIGKDILRFHAAFWPAMLMSAGVGLPKELFVHGFLQLSGMKMGKSTGNVVDPFAQVEKYGIDPFRFYILGAMPIDSDGDYNEEAVIERINNELVANLANFCYRVLSFTNKNLDSRISTIDENKVIDEIKPKFDSVKEQFEKRDFKQAIAEIMEVSALGNRYFQEKEPWKLFKEDEEKAREVLGTCVNIVKCLSILVNPIMPEFSSEIQKQIGVKDLKWKDLDFSLSDCKIGKAKILIKKLENIEIEKVFPLNLKVAQIVKAEEHPEADKLVVLQLDLGEEKRQIVAGIKKNYSVDELVGKKIVVVTNLKPAKLRGIESNGMLLAAVHKDDAIVLEVKDAKPGTQVGFPEYENNTAQIKIDDFAKVKMKVENERAVYDHLVLKAGDEEVIAKGAKDGSKVS